MTPYHLGVLLAAQAAGLVKKPIGAALLGSLAGGAMGAYEPGWLGTDNRIVGTGLGALIGGGAGLGAHGVRSYFRDLRAAGKPVIEKSEADLMREIDELASDPALDPSNWK